MPGGDLEVPHLCSIPLTRLKESHVFPRMHKVASRAQMDTQSPDPGAGDPRNFAPSPVPVVCAGSHRHSVLDFLEQGKRGWRPEVAPSPGGKGQVMVCIAFSPQRNNSAWSTGFPPLRSAAGKT